LDSKILPCSDYSSLQASEEIEIKKHAIMNYISVNVLNSLLMQIEFSLLKMWIT